MTIVFVNVLLPYELQYILSVKECVATYMTHKHINKQKNLVVAAYNQFNAVWKACTVKQS